MQCSLINPRLCSPIAMLLALLASGQSVAGDEAIIRQCKNLQAEISRYDELRRNGGSGPQMDAWKRARSAAQSEFRELGCHYRYHQLR